MTERDHLLNLLARIHRDGGQYVEEHGLEEAVQDADTIVATHNAQVDALRDALLDLLWVRTNPCTVAHMEAAIARAKAALGDA